MMGHLLKNNRHCATSKKNVVYLAEHAEKSEQQKVNF
jgi:hypothetical protein